MKKEEQINNWLVPYPIAPAMTVAELVAEQKHEIGPSQQDCEGFFVDKTRYKTIWGFFGEPSDHDTWYVEKQTYVRTYDRCGCGCDLIRAYCDDCKCLITDPTEFRNPLLSSVYWLCNDCREEWDEKERYTR